MEVLQIRVENPVIKNAVELLFENFKDQFSTFINNVAKNESGSADAFITKGADGVYEVYQTAPDKGTVIGRTGVEGPVGLVAYTSLLDDDKYLVLDGDKLALFVKTVAGTPDLRVGHFRNLNDAVTKFDGEEVQLAIETIKAGLRNDVNNAVVAKKKAEKEIRRLTKKATKA